MLKSANRISIYLVFLIIFFGIWENVSNSEKTNLYVQESFTRKTEAIDFSNIEFNSWDINAAASDLEIREVKPYTIMIYMNGSDLESEEGAATLDLVEMQESGVSSENVNVIVFTGGANRWQNNVIPDNECIIWEISDGHIEEITNVGLLNMGNPGTLSSFIDFTIENFPAEKYGLILWDHGGGSIAGFGHDEKFVKGNLTLLDMNYAFEESKLSEAEKKLEFIGFDSCLMSTVEMAVVASDYAEYLIASEDLEPGEGWNYNFLYELNENPYMDGASLGIIITDYFMEYYGEDYDTDLNLSVTDLSKINRVMHSMGKLMSLCSESLLTDKEKSFQILAKKRNGTKTFGAGSPRDNESDMVDVGDMAVKLADLFPNEAAEVLSSLKEAVIYNRNNSDVALSGLSSYYIYGGKDNAIYSLSTYSSLNMDDDYTGYLNQFYKALLVKKVRSNNNSMDIINSDLTVWKPTDDSQKFVMIGIKNDADTINSNYLFPKINGQNVCMHKIDDSRGLYALTASVNGRDCDIIILVCEKHPDGKILGVRNEEGFIIQKGFDKINAGDKISFYYLKKDFSNATPDSWHKGEEFIAGDEFRLEWENMKGDNIYYSFCSTDVHNNKYFTDLSQ